jgi:hypothetical protein
LRSLLPNSRTSKSSKKCSTQRRDDKLVHFSAKTCCEIPLGRFTCVWYNIKVDQQEKCEDMGRVGFCKYHHKISVFIDEETDDKRVKNWLAAWI